jgi:hypothetical protein
MLLICTTVLCRRRVPSDYGARTVTRRPRGGYPRWAVRSASLCPKVCRLRRGTYHHSRRRAGVRASFVTQGCTPPQGAGNARSHSSRNAPSDRWRSICIRPAGGSRRDIRRNCGEPGRTSSLWGHCSHRQSHRSAVERSHSERSAVERSDAQRFAMELADLARNGRHVLTRRRDGKRA